jgi:pilus assembly protein Flp/PilA
MLLERHMRRGGSVTRHSLHPYALEWTMTKALKRFIVDDSAATAIEYGLIASLIAVVIIGAVSAVGNNLTTTFSEVAGNLH